MKLTRIVVLTALVLGAAHGRAGAASSHNPGIVPINANAHGKSYSELAADWWKWVAAIPTPENPLLDATGADCAINQTDHVWFLAGSFLDGPVTRRCTVPTGTFLFFPLSNDVYGAASSDPQEQQTEEFVRAQTVCEEGAVVTATIDGVPVNNPQQYFELSPFFVLHLPADNVFGATEAQIPGLIVEPTADRGYYLYLNPLPPGRHTIHFTAEPGTSCAAPQDVTYIITVGKK